MKRGAEWAELAAFANALREFLGLKPLYHDGTLTARHKNASRTGPGIPIHETDGNRWVRTRPGADELGVDRRYP